MAVRFALFKEINLVAIFPTYEDSVNYVSGFEGKIYSCSSEDDKTIINKVWTVQRCPYMKRTAKSTTAKSTTAKSTTAKSTTAKSTTAKKPQTHYNIFIQEEIARIKKNDPTIEHKEAFKMAAMKWHEVKPTTEPKEV